MKRLWVCLCLLSIAVNFALGWMLLRVRAPRESENTTRHARSPTAGSREVGIQQAGTVTPQLWQDLRGTDDPAGLVGRLHAAGFPPYVIRSIARGMAADEFAARRAAILRSRPFWKPYPGAALQELDGEQQRLVQEILGPFAPPERIDEVAARERMWGRIPPERVAQLEKLQRDYGEMLAKLAEANHNTIGEKEQRALSLLQEEQERDMRELLTPDELEEYRFRRNSGHVHQWVRDIEVTEDELRALARAEAEFQRKRAPVAGVQLVDRAFEEARTAVTDQAESILGPERFDKYLRAANPLYGHAAEIARSLSLPPQAARELVRLESEGTARIADANTRFANDTAARLKAYEAARDELTARAIALFGEQGFVSYQRRGGGTWTRIVVASGK